MVLQFWLTGASDGVSDGIAKGSRHGKSRAVDILDPYSLWSTETPSPVLGLRNFASRCQYPCFFFVVLRFMVDSERLGFHFALAVQGHQNDTRVANIARDELVAAEES